MDQDTFLDEGQDGATDTIESSEAPAPARGEEVRPERAPLIPPGFKLVPESYVAVEPQMYSLLLSTFRKAQAGPAPAPVRPVEDGPKPVFQIHLLRQIFFGSFGYNAVPGQIIEYCPEEKYVQIDGNKFNDIQSFVSHWRMQFGPTRQRDMDVVRNPFFEILNPDTCPPIEESLGRPVRRPTEVQRIRSEDERWDATRRRSSSEGRAQGPGPHGAALPSAADLDYDPHAREYVTRGQRAERFRQMAPQPQGPPYQQNAPVTMNDTPSPILLPQNPQAAMMQAGRAFPSMPPRGGVRGEDGLTSRARKIKAMSGESIERPVPREVYQPIAGYEPPETVEDFPVDSASMAGGQVVGQIPGQPADEAQAIAQQLDMASQRLQGGQVRYGL